MAKTIALRTKETFNVSCSQCRKTFKYESKSYPAHSVLCPSCSSIREDRPFAGSLGHPDEQQHHRDVQQDPYAHNQFVRIMKGK